jgi:hypothetical protein
LQHIVRVLPAAYARKTSQELVRQAEEPEAAVIDELFSGRCVAIVGAREQDPQVRVRRVSHQGDSLYWRIRKSQAMFRGVTWPSY